MSSESTASIIARAISADESLKNILAKNNLPQALSIEIVYKNKNYSYKDFTGVDPDADKDPVHEYCNNTKYMTRGPVHGFSEYALIWVTRPTNEYFEDCPWDENDTVVIIRFADWDGGEIKIENMIGGMDSVKVYYRIGVLDTVIGELKNSRFTTWTVAKDLFETDGNYLNCYVNGKNYDDEVSKWGRQWTDTKEDDVYGLSIELTVKSVDDLSIRYTCDGKNRPWVEPCNFLTGARDDGSYELWWCANKEMLDCVPESLREDLPNWDEFYEMAAQ
ncbi:MAG: hypothetical protein NC548_61595 [Lachnospiraceae bacterium]|nr:hypothetical protein [Lachnospiraceae bacterium]